MRKGTHYLLSAWRRLQPANAELWLVGEMHLPSELLTDLPASVVIKPRVPRADLDELLMQASVLVLPTLAEGRAHIVLESLSAGLAIITTENSGCGDVVEDEVNGWKIAVRDTDALVAKLFFCINNRERLSEMQRQSLKKAAGWQQADFMKAHTSVIESFLAEREIAMEGQPQFSGMRRQVS